MRGPGWLPIEQILTNWCKVSVHDKLYEAKINPNVKSLPWHQHFLTEHVGGTSASAAHVNTVLKRWQVACHTASSASVDSVTRTTGYSLYENCIMCRRNIAPWGRLTWFLHMKPNMKKKKKKKNHSKDLSVSFSSQVHNVTQHTEARCSLSSDICTLSKRWNLKKRDYHWYFFVENIIKNMPIYHILYVFMCEWHTCFSHLTDVTFARSRCFFVLYDVHDTHDDVLLLLSMYVWVWSDQGAAKVFFYQ